MKIIVDTCFRKLLPIKRSFLAISALLMELILGGVAPPQNLETFLLLWVCNREIKISYWLVAHQKGSIHFNLKAYFILKEARQLTILPRLCLNFLAKGFYISR